SGDSIGGWCHRATPHDLAPSWHRGGTLVAPRRVTCLHGDPQQPSISAQAPLPAASAARCGGCPAWPCGPGSRVSPCRQTPLDTLVTPCDTIVAPSDTVVTPS